MDVSLLATADAHSLYAEMSAELGSLGMLTFLAIFVVLLRQLARLRRRFSATRTDLADLATAFLLTLVSYLGTSVFLHLSFQRYLWLLIALASAAVHVLRSAEREARLLVMRPPSSDPAPSPASVA